MEAEQGDLLRLTEATALRLRVNRLHETVADHAAGRARAFADPTRVLIATVLREVNEICVGDLAWVIEKPHALVSHHVRTLRAQGLVASRREGKLVLYWLTPAGSTVLEGVLLEGRAKRAR
ncbi:MAG: metalloregulator ArsR/SmtB family transcription factor [Gaiellales bacterium]